MLCRGCNSANVTCYEITSLPLQKLYHEQTYQNKQSIQKQRHIGIDLLLRHVQL